MAFTNGLGHSGSVVESLTWDWRGAGLSFTNDTALCPWAMYINPGLVYNVH